MVDIAVEHGLQVTLAEDEQAVCTFGAYGADESFGDGVHTRCLRSGEQHVDANSRLGFLSSASNALASGRRCHGIDRDWSTSKNSVTITPPLRAAGMGKDVISGRESLVAVDGERENFHRFARATPAARRHARRVTRRYDLQVTASLHDFAVSCPDQPRPGNNSLIRLICP
jgi:hypothetical protein